MCLTHKFQNCQVLCDELNLQPFDPSRKLFQLCSHLCFEKAHHSNNILTTYRTFAKHFATIGTSGHMTTFQQHTLYSRIHTYFTQINRWQFIDSYKRKYAEMYQFEVNLRIGNKIGLEQYLGSFADHPINASPVPTVHFSRSIL